MTPGSQEGSGAPRAAALVALLSLRGNIHPSIRLRRDAYVLASAPGSVLTAEELVSSLLAEPKPLRCRATASAGVVKVRWDPPRERTADWLAWQAADPSGPRQEFGSELQSLGRRSGRAAVDVQVLCAARDETLLVSLADVQRWYREYPIVRGRYAFDSAENELVQDWPAYREARARGASFVLRLGEISTAAA